MQSSNFMHFQLGQLLSSIFQCPHCSVNISKLLSSTFQCPHCPVNISSDISPKKISQQCSDLCHIISNIFNYFYLMKELVGHWKCPKENPMELCGLWSIPSSNSMHSQLNQLSSSTFQCPHCIKHLTWLPPQDNISSIFSPMSHCLESQTTSFRNSSTPISYPD